MTQRLRDLDSPSQAEAELVELVRAAEPTVRSDAQMRRLRAALNVTPPRRPAWDLRRAALVVLALFLMAGVAAASATVGRAWLERHHTAGDPTRHERIRKDVQVSPPLTPTAPPLTPLAETVPTATPERGSMPEPSADREERISTPAPARIARTTTSSRLERTLAEPASPRETTPTRHVTSAAAALSPGAAPELGSSLRDVRIVASALAVMRKSHDPKAASELLERYMNDEPNGAFAEAALGLAIEAAAEGDEPERAASRARRYLETYPTGRFVSVAQRALRRFAPAPDQARSPSK